MTPTRGGYSFIRHLAWSLLLNHDPKRCIVTAFTAHYDASGSEADKQPEDVLVVVGLLANEYKWLRFEREWLAVLKTYKVPYFHRKELGDDRRKGVGVYAKWANDEDTPRKFVRALVKVIRRQTHKTFCLGLVLEDYAYVNSIYQLREGVGSPYVLAAARCYDRVNAWGREHYPKNKSLHIFEEGDCGQKDFLKLAKTLGHRPQTMPKKDKETGEWFIPFQGADLVAGAWRHAASRRFRVASLEDYGEEFNEIATPRARDAKVLHRANLMAWCKSNPNTPRRS